MEKEQTTSSTAASTTSSRVFEDTGELLISTTCITGVDAEPSLNRGGPKKSEEKPRYFQNTDGGYLM